MRRLAAVALGAALLAAPAIVSGPVRADEPDPEKVARIIEEIRAYRAGKERGTRRGAQRFTPFGRGGRPRPDRPHGEPRAKPDRPPTGGER